LLIVSSEQSFATTPKKQGLGIRIGQYKDVTKFQGRINQPLRSNDHISYINSDSNGNGNALKTRFPIFIQFDEDLISSWVTTSMFFDINQSVQRDLSPVLEGGSGLNSTGLNNYSVDSSTTRINYYMAKYPQHSSVINSASNPALSANYGVYTILGVKSWGIFLPISDRHRLFSISVGYGISYTYGNYQINVCDPYVFNFEGASFCQNKKELYSASISNFGTGILINSGPIYSYIGDKFDFSLVSGSSPIIYPIILQNNETETLTPVFDTTYIDIAKFALYF
jgi:hypothetical protein